ncbi:MAG: type II secretion system protein [Minisyncoccia bacterium]|jgi:prepilin-type N-terminal cleavage/methylation domain-containing protein
MEDNAIKEAAVRPMEARRGFTLIELLVVVSIIGLLAAIILASLSSARKKGNDARIISDVQQTRVALHLGFNGNGYPDLVNGQNANCNGGNTLNATFANCVNASGPYFTALNALNNDATVQGGVLYYTVTGGNNTNTTAFAIRGQLVANNSAYFCIDSNGRTNAIDNNAAAGSAACH